MRKIDKIILEENMVKEVKIDWRKDIAKEKIINLFRRENLRVKLLQK